MSRMLGFEDLRERDRIEPTLREAHEMAEELMRMFPSGYTVVGTKPEGDPPEDTMYVEDDGRMMIYVGGGVWKQLAVGGPVSSPAPWRDPETVGFPPRLGDPVRDPEHTELLEVLLCPECDNELGSAPCGPRHAFLADNPMNHRLLKPLLERYQEEIRWGEGRQCSLCSVPLASSGCGHVDVRGDQVLMSRETYEELLRLEELRDALTTLAKT